MTIIGVVGLIGSGKTTVANYLGEVHGFKQESFASPLKDAVAAVFGWNREMLEGITPEHRATREQVDPWWADRLGMPHLTPRLMLQKWGTELSRENFHNDIWIASLENKLRYTRSNVVISDCRFPNEINSIRQLGGKIVRVMRGPEPDWYEAAIAANRGESTAMLYRSDVHPSEWAWAGTNFDLVLDNNGSRDELYARLNSAVRDWDTLLAST